MKLIITTLSTLLFSMTTLAATPAEQEHQNQTMVVSLLSQPIEKKESCAKLGYIGYQNSLSGSYVTGNPGNIPKDPVKGYAWSLIAYHQILTTHNQQIIDGQKHTLDYIEKTLQLNTVQKEEATKFANDIITQYGKSWPSVVEQMKYKDFPAPCNLMGIEKPGK